MLLRPIVLMIRLESLAESFPAVFGKARQGAAEIARDDNCKFRVKRNLQRARNVLISELYPYDSDTKL